MSNPRKIYWDSSCFICFLNRDAREVARRMICEDVLQHARKNEIEIYTSTWTKVEVIRPKLHGAAPLPLWATEAIKAVEKAHPAIRTELETLWKRYQANDPAQKLTAAQIEKIHGMFEWEFIVPVNVDERVADKAVEISRTCGLKGADAVHAASAIIAKVAALQKWDRDFEKVAHLITVEEPQQISLQNSLLPAMETIGPTPADFEKTEEPLPVADAAEKPKE